MPLCENEGFLVVNKPAGVSMATSSRAGNSGSDAVERLMEAAEPGRSPAGLWLVHRLDLGTSGAVVLAKSDEAHRALSLAFQERRVDKTYRALVWGQPVPAHGAYDDPLGRDLKDGRKMSVRADGKPSLTRYATQKRFKGIADLQLSPETGRTHQIRVHLAAHGHPIVGDDLYAGATRWHGVRDPERRRVLSQIRRPLLHAATLRVPELGLDVAAPLPEDFEAALATLARS
ncbi:MAG: RNA pseudouridine synthase [Thermoanaerobaculia bacterium]